MDYLMLCAKLISLILLFTIHNATSNDRLLSRIYKKAAEKEKPIVLVLDTANLESVAEAARVKPRSALKSSRNTSIEPFLSLYQLGQKSSLPKKVRFAESIQDEHPELRMKTKYRTNQGTINIFKGQSKNKGPSKKNDRYKDGADNAKKYLIREDLKTVLKNSGGLSSYLRIPSIARGGDDESCFSNSVEGSKENRVDRLCQEYVRKASECTGINFGALHANKSGKVDVKLPSTMGGVLLHEIDWN